VLAVLKMIDMCYIMVIGRPIRLITRHSTLAWLFRSKGLQGRLQQWAALLSPWEITVESTKKGEEELCGLLATSIIPLKVVDEILESISPRKFGQRHVNALPVPSVQPNDKAYVISFDGSAKPRLSRGFFAAILWKLPEWSVIETRKELSDDATVIKTEYQGLILGVRLAKEHDLRRAIICGDSRLVIQQLRGEIECHSPGLKLLWIDAARELKTLEGSSLVHVKREHDVAADHITAKVMQREEGAVIQAAEFEDLRTLNRLQESLIADPGESESKAVAVTTRRDTQRRRSIEDFLVLRDVRAYRIRQAQDEEKWIYDLKRFILGEIHDLTREEVYDCAKIADRYEVDENDLMFFVGKQRRKRNEGREIQFKLVAQLRCMMRFFIITTRAWLGDIRACQGRTRRCLSSSTGVGSTRLSSNTSDLAQIVKPERVGHESMADLPGTSSQAILSRSSAWITSRHCPGHILETRSCSNGSISTQAM
jgi:ribonuclease HI